MDNPSEPTIRPLTRSLDPLAGESLGGYLLRLAHRLRVSPVTLARRFGFDDPPLSRNLLLDLDTDAFAAATRLSPHEAATLTLVPWAERYPPIAKTLFGLSKQVDRWLFNNTPRYCPRCLTGDGSPIQEQHGGPWKLVWHLPISFACPDHQIFLRHCPQPHRPRESWRLITNIADPTLHPAQCRHPLRTGRPGPSSCCAARLDRADTTPITDPAVLTTQQRLLAALAPHHDTQSAEQLFTDLRIITALLRASWPAGADLIDPSMAETVSEHFSQLRSRTSKTLSPPPETPITVGALLAAAVKVLDNQDLPGTLRGHFETTRRVGRPSRTAWAHIVDRHADSCSEALRDAVEPLIRNHRKVGLRGTKAQPQQRLPARTHPRFPRTRLVRTPPRTTKLPARTRPGPPANSRRSPRPILGRRLSR